MRKIKRLCVVVAASVLAGCVSQSDVNRADPADVYQCAVMGDMGIKTDVKGLCKKKIKELEAEGKFSDVDKMRGMQQVQAEQICSARLRGC